MRSSEKDVGWMYHLIPIRKNHDPKSYPPLSQIPGLGLDSKECNYIEPVKSIFKSTDTPYQTLCKMGGLQDLLYHKENDKINKPPVPYPRCDWFYLDDLQTESYKKLNCIEPKKYIFSVPEYMSSEPPKKKEAECIDHYVPTVKERKIKRKRLPDNRPGYSEYTRKPVKLTYAQRNYPMRPKISFPKHDISKELENPKQVMENYYVRDYDQYRKQWNEIKNTETIRNESLSKARLKEMSKDLKNKLKFINKRRLNSVFPFA